MSEHSDIRIEIVDSHDVDALIAAATRKEYNAVTKSKIASQKQKGLEKRGFVEFTDKEMRTIPLEFRKLLIIDGNRCRLRKRTSGKNSYTYELRLRREGYNISASGKTIELAKSNFIKRLRELVQGDKEQSVPNTFNAFSMYYFKQFREPKVAVKTFANDLNRYKNYLLPHFGEKVIKKITPGDCKTLLDEIKATGKGKTADEVHSLMSIIFKGAIAHGLIERNPLDIVLHTKHERKSGSALSREEETLLINSLQGDKERFTVGLALYCGLRPNELASARLEGDFVVAVNSKRKGKRVEYKRIPILPKLRDCLPDGKQTKVLSVQKMRKVMKSILPNHILYDLRTTFYTRCVECGVDEIARKLFVGHSLGTLTKAYTDVSDEYLKKEAEKLHKW